MIRIEHGLRGARRSLKRLADARRAAGRAAQNKALAKMRTAVRGALARELRVPVGAVKRRFVLRRAGKAGQPAALVVLVARGVNAARVRGARDRRPHGVAAGAARFPHAFIAGGRALERRGRARLPLRGTDVPVREPAERLGRRWLAGSGAAEHRRILRRELEFRSRRALAK